jgi:glutamyl-tRNA synthetase
MKVKTRFAPSPTGFLHVGGVRTALFSWLFAKHNQGEFILRIEDTDKVRSTQESITAILEGMAWLGLDYDQGPFYQTQRYGRYAAISQQLLEENKAYRCNCSKERLEKLREEQLANKEKPRYDDQCRDKNLSAGCGAHVIRFKNPKDGIVSFTDHVYGKINVANSELDDLILVRSDGHPTYNFAVVIDDWDMEITHVIRGDDHINNTPRQINIFKALDAPLPEFAHLPMILGEDGRRLSKRHGAVSVMQFRELGILPHALLNYLVRLGWSHGDQEIFSFEEMIALFNLGHVSRGVSSFNYEKLHWLNQHYQKEDAPEEVAKALQWHFDQMNLDVSSGPALVEIVKVQAERCKTLKEMAEKSSYFYSDNLLLDPEAVKKHLRPVTLEPMQALYYALEQVSDWHPVSLQTCIDNLCTSLNLNMGKIAQPLRVAITGGSNSPGIDATLALIGKTRVLKRIAAAIDVIKARSASSE